MRAEPDTKWASRPRTILELAAVRACHPEKEPDAAMAERLERVEKLIESGAAARPPRRRPPGHAEAPESPRAKKPAPKAAPTPAETPPQAYLDAIAGCRRRIPPSAPRWSPCASSASTDARRWWNSPART